MLRIPSEEDVLRVGKSYGLVLLGHDEHRRFLGLEPCPARCPRREDSAGVLLNNLNGEAHHSLGKPSVPERSGLLYVARLEIGSNVLRGKTQGHVRLYGDAALRHFVARLDAEARRVRDSQPQAAVERLLLKVAVIKRDDEAVAEAVAIVRKVEAVRRQHLNGGMHRIIVLRHRADRYDECQHEREQHMQTFFC